MLPSSNRGHHPFSDQLALGRRAQSPIQPQGEAWNALAFIGNRRAGSLLGYPPHIRPGLIDSKRVATLPRPEPNDVPNREFSIAAGLK